MFLKRKGQTIVEFALVVPIFFAFLFGIFYAGMFVVDYVTLDNFAQRQARLAVLGKATESTAKVNRFLADWYDLSPVDVKDENGSKVVTITATLSTKSAILKVILPEKYYATASMYAG